MGVRLLRDESGQDLAEYGLLSVLIAVVVAVAVALLGPLLAELFRVVTSSFP